MARPNKGLGHVEKLQGDPLSKQRLQAILSTITREQRVGEACAELGIGPSYFDQLRTRVLRAGIDALAPRPVGRPQRMAPVNEQEVEALRQRIAQLEEENAILQTRLVLAAVGALREDQHPKSPRGAGSLFRRQRSAAAARRKVP